ncbi:uncharacterized protein METZ01_LOCUS281412 [marine metagenome]|uniref:Uncharacterized protein n=1 Tax=marine metagenome TaxID=408172 RepID=A0A382KVB6_9ZZZZ
MMGWEVRARPGVWRFVWVGVRRQVT